jgi:acetoin utilization deacetylase AcuC-like enzyme
LYFQRFSDRLGKLALTDTGIFRREMQVLSTCVAAGYPVGCVIGGGYLGIILCYVAPLVKFINTIDFSVVELGASEPTIRTGQNSIS